ncbi:MAG: TerB family tellurite resistance protein [Bacteroidia bacterium]
MDTTNWTQEHYRAFALTYAAYVDGSFNEDEREMIIQEVGGEIAQEINKQGKKLSDYECLQILQGEREKFYQGTEGKEKLLGELSELFNTDGEFSQLEKVVLRNLKRLL